MQLCPSPIIGRAHCSAPARRTRTAEAHGHRHRHRRVRQSPSPQLTVCVAAPALDGAGPDRRHARVQRLRPGDNGGGGDACEPPLTAAITTPKGPNPTSTTPNRKLEGGGGGSTSACVSYSRRSRQLTLLLRTLLLRPGPRPPFLFPSLLSRHLRQTHLGTCAKVQLGGRGQQDRGRPGAQLPVGVAAPALDGANAAAAHERARVDVPCGDGGGDDACAARAESGWEPGSDRAESEGRLSP